MMKITFAFIFFCIGVMLPTSIQAVSTGFTTQLQVGVDSIPPSTPTSLLAVPASQTQIDLSWGASTDNFLLGGYQVFRNLLQIATTTLTTYSDSGLTSGTSYTYYVKAFDSSFNTSSSSNIMTTSTRASIAITTPATTQSGEGQVARPQLLTLSIEPALHSVKISWTTSQYVQFELRWGRTVSYELGFVSNELYKKDHSTSIDELEPGTTYEFQIIAYDRDGRRTALKEGQFKTLDAPDIQAPTNVSNLRAIADGTNVQLTWDNPKDADFSRVRVVRSYLFYPSDPADGYIAYNDNGDSLYDRDAFLQSKILYYSVFSYDDKGNISSGAVVRVQSRTDGTIDTIDDDPVVGTSSSVSLLFSDFDLLQNNQLIAKDDINTELPLTMRIAYAKLPEHLKTITVTLRHSNDMSASFSFLLRINKDKTFYEASIAPLRSEGAYPVVVAVFDYQTQKLFSLRDTLFAHKKITTVDTFTQTGPMALPLILKIFGAVSLVVILWLLIFYRILRRVKSDI